MASSAKDTFYVDIDDEITSIIEKVQDSKAKVVALVLPKRATVFQSTVNLKLLKRSSAEAKKHIVLITSEASLLPMAGAVGIHVAKTLQSKPSIPDAPAVSDKPVSVSDGGDIEKEAEQYMASPDEPSDEETIEVDDVVSDADEGKPTKKGNKDKALKPGKRFKIPNFNKFRIRLFAGIALFVLLAAGWAYAYFVLPEAKITIKTNNVSVLGDITFAASPAIEEVNVDESRIPAKLEEFKKTESLKVAATGEKDVGTKATGKVTLELEDCASEEVTIPAGTRLTSAGLSFTTNAEVLLKRVQVGNQCKNQDYPEFSTATVNVTAEEAGDKYNLSPREYTVTGLPGIGATGQAMSGGTSKIITIVSQQDIDDAKNQVVSSLGDIGRQTVQGQLQAAGFIPVIDTFSVSSPLVTATPNVGEEAPEVTVNVSITYKMSGAQQDGVQQLLEKNINEKIDTSTQNILNDGIDTALIKLTETKDGGEIVVSVKTTALAGVQQDIDAIKQSVIGKKKGEVQNILSNTPGVEDVTVEFSPFWVYKTPNSPDKITIIFQQNDGTTTSGE